LKRNRQYLCVEEGKMSKKIDKMSSIFILPVFLLPSSASSESTPEPFSGVADEVEATSEEGQLSGESGG
jgi:hypothetical protein